MKKLIALLIFLAALAPAPLLAQAKVTITGTLTLPDAGTVNGTITLRAPFTF